MASGSDSWLRRFPNTAIGISLGLGAQAVLWKALLLWPRLQGAAGFIVRAQFSFWALCVATLVLYIIVYAAKCIWHRDVMWAEFYHPVRANFFCGPCISVCFIALALPPAIVEGGRFLRAAWTFAFFYQSSAALVIYRRWLYDASTSDLAAAPFLMSVVAWFLLAGLGDPAQIDEAAGMPLRAMCFGVGAFFATFLYPFVLLGIHAGRTAAGSPPLFLLIAPLASAALALIGLAGGLSPASEALFGVVLFIFVLLLANGPSLLPRPAVLGVYWAYVFPVSALATLSVKVAGKYQTVLADFTAASLACFAILAVVMVFVRMSVHQYTVCMGRDVWSDPIVTALDRAAAKQREGGVRNAMKGLDAGCGEDGGAAPAAPAPEEEPAAAAALLGGAQTAPGP